MTPTRARLPADNLDQLFFKEAKALRAFTLNQLRIGGAGKRCCWYYMMLQLLHGFSFPGGCRRWDAHLFSEIDIDQAFWVRTYRAVSVKVSLAARVVVLRARWPQVGEITS